jgi:hypothetical protein
MLRRNETGSERPPKIEALHEGFWNAGEQQLRRAEMVTFRRTPSI